jgi:hypothetical protein
MKINKIRIIVLSIVIFAIGGGIGYGAEYYCNFRQTKYLISNILPVRENNFNYKFIYPLLRYEFGDAKYYLENKDLEQKINNYIQKQYQDQNAESISVYFSNLLTGRWSGVNADTQYIPGSLMKVLIMMGYYRESQLDQSTMQKSFTYSKEVDQAVQSIPNVIPTNLIIGQSYTTKYITEDMIENSDDGAEVLLLANIDKKIFDDVFEDLKIPALGTTLNYTISPKDYTAFLKILYNSTYMTEVNSEEALSFLSKTTYHDGIYAGVPSGVIVAQKYGEAVDTDPTSEEIVGTDLHDCGIIYAKTYPYTLCIMTKAKGLVAQKQLASIIKDISAIVYSYVSSGGGK